jgi:Fe-S cluster biogenesis protein NfuA
MEKLEIQVEDTPNPNAKKFAINHAVKAEGRMGFDDPDKCYDNVLAKKLLLVEGIKQVHFFENVITVSIKDKSWADLEESIKNVIQKNILDHDPYFTGKSDKPETEEEKIEKSHELEKIDKILDDTVRYRLQMDGGDIELLRLDDKDLYVRYQGACGSCPAAFSGTLMVIEEILRAEYDKNIRVIPV